MSTRANVVIRSRKQRLLFQYMISSDGYPSGIIPELTKFKGDIRGIDLCMEPGKVGNSNYFYEVNADCGSVLAWESQRYWVSAPDNWQELGWVGCIKGGPNNTLGYRDFRKGKRLFGEEKKIDECEIQLFDNDRYSKADWKLWTETEYYFKYWIDKLKCDPTRVHTWLSVCYNYDSFYKTPLRDVPLDFGSDISKWRLRIGK